MSVKTPVELLKEIREKVDNNLSELETQVSDVRERQVKAEETIRDLEKSITANSGGLLPGLEEEVKKRKPSWMQIVRGIKWNDWGDGYEKHIIEQANKAYEKRTGRLPGVTRVMGTETDSAGGNLVPTEAMSDLIEKLDAKAVVLRAGARLMPGFTESPVLWPKITGGATAYWVEENAAITPSDMAFGQLRLEPKRLAALSKLSQRLVRMAVPAADAVIEADFARRLALALDLAVLQGTGADAQPLGIQLTSGIGTYALGTNGDYLSYKHVVGMFGVAEDDNADVGDGAPVGIITHPSAIRILQLQQVDSGQSAGDRAGAHVYPPILSRARLAEVTGMSWGATTQLPTNLTKGSNSVLTRAFFANWSECMIAQWFGMTMDSTTTAGDAFEKSQLWLKLEMEVDVGLRHPESFVMAEDVATTDPID